ncbi:GTP cyclohydrolase II [Opitutaceae bacterium TAV1]|nr:GTP cyclohydrolase II [Opitutaceae bacterium TAV1]
MSVSAPILPDSAATPDFDELIARFQHASGSVLEPRPFDDRPVYGTTLYIATCTLDTRFGYFRAHIFQDIIDKHYIIALVHGDIVNATTLYTRLHSSCITSETLRGGDCDCVQQLEGAFRVIAGKGNGILFYLMQEGRGVGYMGKARDRMLVQASLDQLSTFAAYSAMGLKKDHRNYENISHICYLLGIRASFIVLTNNPDKVEAMKSQGLAIAGTEALEFEPSPFNLAYLTSKAAGGHSLKRPAMTEVKRALPPEPVIPFKPHALPEARRFIYAASYFLPVKPVDNEILITEARFRELFRYDALSRYTAGSHPPVLDCRAIRGNRFFVRISVDNFNLFKRDNPDDPVLDLLTTPYWFRVHVYYDIVTSQDFVVLTHGTPQIHDLPVVRVHSESLFNRFPLRTVENRDKLKQSVKHIVTYGVGAMLLLHNDGRGAGFGAYATDRMMTDSNQALSSDEAYRKLGVGYDSRDYDCSIILLRHHIPNEKIQMVMNSPTSLVRKPEYAEALNRHKIDVERWIFLEGEPASPAHA